jgi:hypothetical protein
MRTLMVLAILALVASAAYAQGRPQRGRQRQDNSPKVGDDAPNFKATYLLTRKEKEKREREKKRRKKGKKEEEKPEGIELKKVVEETGKPVVLIFGSYT